MCYIASLLNLDFLELGASQFVGSQSTLHPTGSLSSMSSQNGRRHSTVNRNGRRRSYASQNSSRASIAGHMQSQAEVPQGSSDGPKSKRKHSVVAKSKKKMPKQSLSESKQEQANDQLPPIREFEENPSEIVSPDAKESKLSVDIVKSYISMVHSNQRPLDKEVGTKADLLAMLVRDEKQEGIRP